MQNLHMFQHTEAAKHTFCYWNKQVEQIERGWARLLRGSVYSWHGASTDPSIIVKLLRCGCCVESRGVVAVTRWFTAGAAYALIKCHFAKFRRSNLPARNSPMLGHAVEQQKREREMRPKEGHFWRPTDPQLCSQHVRFPWVMALSITICCYRNWGNNCTRPCSVLIQISWPRIYTYNYNIYLTHAASASIIIWSLKSHHRTDVLIFLFRFVVFPFILSF